MSYIICEADEKEDLVELVNEKIAEGYVPLGGVSCSLSEGLDYRYTRYCQAMLLMTADSSGDATVVQRDSVEFQELAATRKLPPGNLVWTDNGLARLLVRESQIQLKEPTGEKSDATCCER